LKRKQIWRSYFIRHTSSWVHAMVQVCMNIIPKVIIADDDFKDIKIESDFFIKSDIEHQCQPMYFLPLDSPGHRVLSSIETNSKSHFISPINTSE